MGAERELQHNIIYTELEAVKQSRVLAKVQLLLEATTSE